MKYILYLIMALFVTANSIAASGLCLMENKVIAEQAQSTPCHDNVNQLTDEEKSHSCECDSCLQQGISVTPISIIIPILHSPTHTLVHHEHLNFGVKYRPPINHSV